MFQRYSILTTDDMREGREENGTVPEEPAEKNRHHREMNPLTEVLY